VDSFSVQTVILLCRAGSVFTQCGAHPGAGLYRACELRKATFSACMAERRRSVRLHRNQLLRFNAAEIALNRQDAEAYARAKPVPALAFFPWGMIRNISLIKANSRFALRQVTRGITPARTCRLFEHCLRTVTYQWMYGGPRRQSGSRLTS
jgi:hypothetical protein